MYQNTDHELWVGPGYATGENWDSFTLINPVSITRFAEYEYEGAERRRVKKICASGVLDETRHFY